jgi:hypothetical protein
MRIVEVTRVVDAMEHDGRRDQSRKVHGVRSAQRLGGSEGVNEEGVEYECRSPDLL